jgi:DNA-binding CsgD family transcriptional regulator
MKAGALDVLEKPVDPETLLERVQNALALSRQQVQAEAERRVIERRLARVTPRERQVLWLLVRGGLSNRQMAAELGCTEKTIKVHRGKVTRKMQCESVAALVFNIQRLSVDQVRRWFGDDAAATDAAATMVTWTRARGVVVPPTPLAALSPTASAPSRAAEDGVCDAGDVEGQRRSSWLASFEGPRSNFHIDRGRGEP